MSTDLVTAPTLGLRNKIGLVLGALLGLADLAGLAIIGQPESGENGPPDPVLIAGAVLGVITLVAVVWAWRGGGRLPARIVAGARILSAITSLPAFFVGGVPAGLIAVAAASIVVTVIAVGLVLSRPASAPAAGLAAG